MVAALPENYRASCVDLVDTATAQLREDKDPDVRAVMRGDTEEETGTACDTVIPTFTSLDNVISEVQILTGCPMKTGISQLWTPFKRSESETHCFLGN